MKHENSSFDGLGIGERFDLAARPILTVDVKKYQALLDESGLSDEQKEEFLQALWSMVVTFVELGFGVHPLQEVCGQDYEDCMVEVTAAFNEVESEKFEKT